VQRTINVTATPNANGWTCKVRIEEKGRTVSEHAVTVTKADKQRFAPDSTVGDLVKRSFEFLLEHEPPQGILSHYNLTDIQRYFPEWDGLIRG
jgi:hypothetical protein